MSSRFNGYCPRCPNKALCFDNEICMRRTMGNEHDDDDNINDLSDISDDDTELTNESTYSFYAPDPDTGK